MLPPVKPENEPVAPSAGTVCFVIQRFSPLLGGWVRLNSEGEFDSYYDAVSEAHSFIGSEAQRISVFGTNQQLPRLRVVKQITEPVAEIDLAEFRQRQTASAEPNTPEVTKK